jgi:acyl-CoA synthetase (AMP-forming)/AMP-acid ligase II
MQNREPRSPYDLLVRQAGAFSKKPLLVLPEAVAKLWGEDRVSWTYDEVLAIVDGLAERYASQGYGAGHRVALLLENRADHFFHWLAFNRLGVSVVPVNPDYTAEELSYLLEHSESALLVTLESRLGQVGDVARALGVPVALAGKADIPTAAAPRPGAAVADKMAECAVIYTSGTTGRPKGCLLSNDYFLAWGDWYVGQEGLIGLREGEERLMTPLPCFHVNAMGNSFMGMLASGGAQIIVDRFHPRDWWKTAIETEATCFHYLGVMPAILLEIPPSVEDRQHRLRFGLGGGVHPEHHALFERRFGVPLLEGWAMTESGGACLLCAAEEPRHVGERYLGRYTRPGPRIEVRLVDDDQADVPVGIAGELLVRAGGEDKRKAMFSGYLKNAAATDEVWAGGWLHTGDIMRMDETGGLYFVDRKKNIIRHSGENIAAVEVEGVIGSHESVARVAVIAVLDPLRGEEVLAVVVPSHKEAKGDAAAKAIFDHCATRLAYYKLPGYLVFVDALPTTSTQKVRKQDLGSVATDPLGVPFSHDFRDRKQALRVKR